MKTFKFLLLCAVCWILVADVSAQTKKRKTVKKNKTITAKTTIKPMRNRTPLEIETGEIKKIAEGTNSKVEEPFFFVARSSETYEQMQKLIENLPSVSEIDFTHTAVVAAFAGMKNTGGYSVGIKNMSDKIIVDVISPPKGAMVAQMITSPYLVALVPVEQETNLALDFSPRWKTAAQTFQVTKGEFEYSGGITGRGKSFLAEGIISVLGFGDFVTLIFKLSGRGSEKERKIWETASGTFKDNKIDLARLNAGSFSENPKPPVKVSGTLSENKLNLKFEPLPTTIADGFSVSGTIEALKLK